MEEKLYSKVELVRDLKNLGVAPGDLLDVKCSYRSIGYKIEGGPGALIDAILDVVGEEGTIVTNSFIPVYPITIFGKVARKEAVDQSSPSYAGALANAILSHPRVVRSSHPVQKFAAIGKHARTLMVNHTPDVYAYDVLRAMAFAGGKSLKIGSDEKVVGVSTQHISVGFLGFRQKRSRVGVMYNDEKGRKKLFERNWAGLCHDGLIKFMPAYRAAGAILHEGKIGEADSKITDMKRTLEVEIDLLKKNPRFFMCDSPTCMVCRVTWENLSQESLPGFIISNALKGKLKPTAMAVKFLFTLKKYYPSEPPKYAEYPGLSV